MFSEIFATYDWETVKNTIYAKTEIDVRAALSGDKCSLEDFQALLSPAAQPFLEEMARLSHLRTRRRFGNTIQLYAPLYLSNECQNICTYCAFSLDNKIARKVLNEAELMAEAKAVRAMGFEHVLLVTGESDIKAGLNYLLQAVRLLRPVFTHISIEVQPLDQDAYTLLAAAGVSSVLVYQETYNKHHYKDHHPKGRKSNFNYRLETPDRLGKAGVRKIGLGTLIGLEDWRTDCFFTGLHLRYLEMQYWQTSYTVSFPRLRPIAIQDGADNRRVFDGFISDRELVQLICAWRLFSNELELSISTREEAIFRDHIVPLGITSMSAGSRTNPGGYTVASESLEQFEIADERSPAQVADMIRRQGYEPVWKDWDKSFL